MRVLLQASGAASLLALVPPALSFRLPSASPRPSPRVPLFMVATSPTSSLTTADPATGASNVLADAFGALNESDQYDAVLTGLCAKILDGPGPADAEVLAGPLQLLEEMNGRGVAVSARSLGALVDTAAKSQSPRVVGRALRSLRQNRRPAPVEEKKPARGFFGAAAPAAAPPTKSALDLYGALQAQYLPPLPSRPNARAEALAAAPPLPRDVRDEDVVAATSVGALVAACLFLDATDGLLFHTELWQPDLALAALAVVAVLDSGYGYLRAASKFVKEVPDLPASEIFGTGELTGGVVRGAERLLKTDTERECGCEAAGFFAAYVLGLPCFAFRPNALEAAVLVYETHAEGTPEGLLTRPGLLKVLTWLLAPVAYEQYKHPAADGGPGPLLSSDPREATGLLRRLAERAADMGAAQDWAELGMEDEQEAEEVLRWAMACADRLVRENAKEIEGLAQGLAGGASTVGDLVATVEGW
mmetsp:Transcript_12829/g.25644  ORF Transcript_12829/g.25644 Transcript_12829/m.25644 type:complete len:475 (-) Transcript_12829:312-1736(-)|eukprot:CAMPEP_0194303108 /NCGR_PEP_ID=MMETSP0171-20130528/1028_1 /TAXON_ID=218684 /ORGANISM="Corethron pennatum, Strain L29A3" /LENGTH=474 /DNA_ID=CAMNT_0039053867 /DNA_START=284 /DNA_END=1708 /DNA_ORIENTATION=-